jgi:hypothetical protein
LLYVPKVMGFIITPFEALLYGTALKLAVASKYPLIRSYVNIIEGFVE